MLDFRRLDFGKLADLRGVSFALPDTPAATAAVLRTAPRTDDSAPWLHLGAPAWARRDWLGKLYPPGTPPARFLGTYAQHLTAIELNATFYNTPSTATLEAWVRDTPPRFRFCPKLPKSITHDLVLSGAARKQAQAFARHMARLGDRLGPYLLALPPHFAPPDAPRLRDFLRAFEGEVMVEFRHPAWFHEGTLRPEAQRALKGDDARAAGTVITDVAGRRDVCHATLTRPRVMVRFVGNGLASSDEPRCAVWLDRLVTWRRMGLEEAFFFVHQPDDLLAPELLSHTSKLARGLGLQVPEVPCGAGPEASPRQLSLGL